MTSSDEPIIRLGTCRTRKVIGTVVPGGGGRWMPACVEQHAEKIASHHADDCAHNAEQRGFEDEEGHDPGARRAHGEHGANLAGALKHGHQQSVDAGHEDHEEDDDAQEDKDAAEEGADLFVVRSQVDPLLEDQVLRQAAQSRSQAWRQPCRCSRFYRGRRRGW